MINGGLGVASQLRVLNSLLQKNHRRNETSGRNAERSRGKRRETTRVMSCDAALTFLSQVQTDANVAEDFVSDERVSRGAGATNRAHAMDSIEDQMKQAQENVDEATKKAADARTKRAKANWHLAVELITTGAGEEVTRGRISPRFASLWRWRYLCINLKEREEGNGNRFNGFPSSLQRGWRPHPSFSDDILAIHPTFAWAHIHTLLLESIPQEVSIDNIASALCHAARKEARAKARLANLRKRLDKAKGSLQISRIEADIGEAQEQLQEAIAYDQALKIPKVTKTASCNVLESSSSDGCSAIRRQ